MIKSQPILAKTCCVGNWIVSIPHNFRHLCYHAGGRTRRGDSRIALPPDAIRRINNQTFPPQICFLSSIYPAGRFLNRPYTPKTPLYQNNSTLHDLFWETHTISVFPSVGAIHESPFPSPPKQKPPVLRQGVILFGIKLRSRTSCGPRSGCAGVREPCDRWVRLRSCLRHREP